ncbi:hypothetical protein PAMA_014312 [Pampus argenteus]
MVRNAADELLCNTVFSVLSDVSFIVRYSVEPSQTRRTASPLSQRASDLQLDTLFASSSNRCQYTLICDQEHVVPSTFRWTFIRSAQDITHCPSPPNLHRLYEPMNQHTRTYTHKTRSPGVQLRGLSGHVYNLPGATLMMVSPLPPDYEVKSPPATTSALSFLSRTLQL